MGKGKGDSAKIGRIAMVNRDGSEITFKDWNGDKKTSKYAPFATLFGRIHDGRPMISVALDKNLVLKNVDKDEIFLNIYLEKGVDIEFDIEDLNAEAENRRGGGGGKRGKKSPKREEPEGDEDDENDPFA